MESTETSLIAHPFETLFDLDAVSTQVDTDSVVLDLVPYDQYDTKDCEIEQQIETIYNTAMLAFAAQTQYVASQPPDASAQAKNMDVAKGFLDSALNAVNAKMNLKNTNKKNTIAERKVETNVTNNNLIIDRDTLLKTLMMKDTDL